MTINLALDLARFVEDAVRAGRYESADDVVRDALTRLQHILELTSAATDESGEPVLQEKPLTKHALQHHLAELGLVDEPPETSTSPPPIEDEDEIISEHRHPRASDRVAGGLPPKGMSARDLTIEGPMPQPYLWKPTPAVVEHANISRFMKRHRIADYRELIARSTADIEWFWNAVIEDLEHRVLPSV